MAERYKMTLSGRDDFTRLCHMRFDTDAVTYTELLNAYSLLMTKFTSDISGVGWDKLSFNITDTISPGVPEPEANKDIGITLKGISAKDSSVVTLKIVAPNMGLINSDGTVDMTNTALMDFLALYFESGPLRLSDGEAVVRWISGKMDED